MNLTMKFKFLFAFILFAICFLGIAHAEPELKIVSVDIENEILKIGESTKVTVTVENIGDSDAYDLMFALFVSTSDANDIKVSGQHRRQDLDDFKGYFTDAEVILKPGDTKNTSYIVTIVSANSESYLLLFAAGARLGKDEVFYREIVWWPEYTADAFSVPLKIKLPIDHYLNKSKNFLKNGNFETAKKYAERAKELYINSNYALGAANCDEIILQSEKLHEGDIAYRKAISRLNAEDYKRALISAEISYEIYNEINNKYKNSDSINHGLISSRISELKQVIDKLNETVSSEKYFSAAKKYLEDGEGEKAREYAERAKIIYAGINDDYMVSQCDSIIHEVNSKNTREFIFSILGIIVAVIISIYIIFWFYKKSREETEGSRDSSDPGLTISSAIRIPPGSSGFSEVMDFSEIPEEAMEPYADERIHDLIAKGKTIVKCNECGAYYDKEILKFYNENCARYGCGNSTL